MRSHLFHFIDFSLHVSSIDVLINVLSSGGSGDDGDKAAAAAAAGGLFAMLGVAGGIAICCSICILMPGFNSRLLMDLFWNDHENVACLGQ